MNERVGAEMAKFGLEYLAIARLQRASLLKILKAAVIIPNSEPGYCPDETRVKGMITMIIERFYKPLTRTYVKLWQYLPIEMCRHVVVEAIRCRAGEGILLLDRSCETFNCLQVFSLLEK